ncbi:hypothetical protein OROGR_005606 [Orobanche gracilis]
MASSCEERVEVQEVGNDRDMEQKNLQPEIMELSLEEQIRVAREKLHNDIRDVEQKLKSLGFERMEFDDQVRWLGMKLKGKKQDECPTELLPQWTRFNALLVHLSRCRVKSLLNEDDASEEFCQYPKCERGKLLWGHVASHDGNLCILCHGLLHIVIFHSLTCTESYCRVPRWRSTELKEHRERKERRERKKRKNEERLERMRETEKHMRALYLSQANIKCTRGSP